MNLIAQKFTNPIVGETLNQLETGESDAFLNMFIPKFVSLLFVFGALGFFFMFVWGAVSWILSGGDKAGVEASRVKITNSLVGFILLIASFAIIMFIEKFFDIDILSIDIGPLTIE